MSPSVLAANRHRDSPYNYIPTRSVAIIFVVLYGISTGNLLTTIAIFITKNVM
jgi:hypothetical protein